MIDIVEMVAWRLYIGQYNQYTVCDIIEVYTIIYN